MKRLPVICFHPGEFLKDELEARGVSIDSFSKMVGVDIGDLNMIIAGNKKINSKIAEKLGGALGVSSAFWINSQKAYDKWKSISMGQPYGVVAER